MDLSQAIEQASAFVIPGFLSGDEALTAERRKNEEAISLLTDAWMSAPAGSEPFSFDLVRNLADRNRAICDSFGIERLRNESGTASRAGSPTRTSSARSPSCSTVPSRRCVGARARRRAT